MADYKSLYYQLFNKITDIIEELKEIQQQAEELYINTSSVDEAERNQKSIPFEDIHKVVVLKK